MGLIALVHLAFQLLSYLIIAGVILSMVRIAVRGAGWLYSPAVSWIIEITDRILRPFRKLIERLIPAARTLPIDFSPLVALLTLNLLDQLIINLLWNIGIR
jgi:YggT family protein